MTTPPILLCGTCERLKAGTHALALVTAATCAAYNLSAWLVRRQRHLAINAIVYSAAVGWELMHVRHHLGSLAATQAPRLPAPQEKRVA
jgi:hypothetical protein